ncbi:MAG: cytidine deaminase [Thermosphaera aggregans]|jgi:cytidine deaminase|uniref:cytidine deaminase n=1 Tax=Thermosphaera aggregans TaxID=54254 RepID=UPI003C10FE5D
MPDDQTLVSSAVKALRNSYAPYSNIHVAASVLGSNGKVYTGVNVENASYGLTICAERSAVVQMVSDGERKPVKIAIVTDMKDPIPPCGACRQFIAEFNPDVEIILHSVSSGKTVRARLSELFPNPFTL